MTQKDVKGGRGVTSESKPITRGIGTTGTTAVLEGRVTDYVSKKSRLKRHHFSSTCSGDASNPSPLEDAF